MTTHELRVLYLLRKAGGRAKHSHISQAMSRTTAASRIQTLSDLEKMDLISSARTPAPKGQGKGGTGGMVYWLTERGTEHVCDMIRSGQLNDPAKEVRGRPKQAAAC